MYGGNAFLYHMTLAEYALLLEWLSSLADEYWLIPSLGPSYGRAFDQATLLRNFQFPCAMILPCGDPRDATGLAAGYREIAEAAQKKLIIYLKDVDNFGPDRDAGLDVVASLVEDGICCGIKYAVVCQDPSQDVYLEALLKRVDRQFVISGMGERPAVAHMLEWKLPGFTTGSGCLAPSLSQMLWAACQRGDQSSAMTLRADFLPLEDLRDEWNPAKVLHHATALAGVAETGQITPYLSPLSNTQLQQLRPVAQSLIERQTRRVLS